MRNTASFLGALVLTLVFVNQTQAQQPAAPVSAPEDLPRNEVQSFLQEAEKRGDPVYGVCLENCEKTISPDGVVIGKATDLVKPEYPAIARMAHAEGTVEVRVILDTEGKVIAAHAFSGHPLLQATSVAAARNSRFKPSTIDGKAVKVLGIIRYNFAAL